MLHWQLKFSIFGGEDFFFSFNNLEGDTEYYYRAFFAKQYPDGYAIQYADEILPFHTEQDSLRAQLCKLYEDTDGDNWDNNENWCSDRPLEEWYGISKDENGLYSINLSQNGLHGSVSLHHSDIKELNLRSTYGSNIINSVDLENCTSLESLNLRRVEFLDEVVQVPLNLSGCNALKWLDISGSNLESLDLFHCKELEYLNCGDGNLHSLVVRSSSLDSLICSENKLETLDLSECTSLRYLFCSDNELSSLEISNCKNLEYINCVINKLSEIDVAGLTRLILLMCGYNMLTSLDVSNNKLMETLDCEGNRSLQSINASGCSSLYNFNNISLPLLREANFTDCSSIERLYFDGYTYLEELNVSGCTSLKELWCRDLQSLRTLDVSSCISLEKLLCGNSQITSLRVSGLANLKDLRCENNLLTSLDLTGLTSLEWVYCNNNLLTSLDLTGLTRLKSAYCGNNLLTSLEVDHFCGIECTNNRLVKEITGIYADMYRKGCLKCDRLYKYMDWEGYRYYTKNEYGWYYPDEPYGYPL